MAQKHGGLAVQLLAVQLSWLSSCPAVQLLAMARTRASHRAAAPPEKLGPKKPFMKQLTNVVDLDEAEETKNVRFRCATFYVCPVGWREGNGSPEFPFTAPDATSLISWQQSSRLDSERVCRRHIATELFIFQHKAYNVYRVMGRSNAQLHSWLREEKLHLGFNEISTQPWRDMVEAQLTRIAAKAAFVTPSSIPASCQLPSRKRVRPPSPTSSSSSSSPSTIYCECGEGGEGMCSCEPSWACCSTSVGL